MPAVLTLTLNPAVDLFTRTAKVQPTHKLRCGPAVVHPGGGGINVARVLARFGIDVLALYPCGGHTGVRFGALLASEGIPARTIPIGGETRESFTVHEDERGLDWRFVLPGPTLAAHEWQACLSAAVDVQPGAMLAVASGSLPPGVPEDFHGRLSRLLAARNVRLAIDSSGPAFAAALRAGVYLAKPSLRELREFTGEPLATREERLAACRRIVGAGQAEVVALSLGSEGALLVTAGQAWHADALAVDVVSTIGAGDSFLAGLVLARERGSGWRDALAHAIAASAATLLTAGTALCRPDDLDRLLPQVRVEAVG